MFTAAQAFETATAYYREGQLAPAQQLFRHVLELEPSHAQAAHFLASISLELGDCPAAVEYFRRAAEAQPGNAAYWKDLGAACITAGMYSEGAAALHQALRLRPDYPEAYHHLGMTCQQLADPGQAASCFRRVVAFRPNFVDAWFFLATALEEQGLFDEAVPCYRKVLELQPSHAGAYFGLSKLAAEDRCSLTPNEVRQLRTLAAAERGSLEERSTLCFALAAVLDRQGAYDEAFCLCRQANELGRKHRSYDAASHRAWVDRMIATFDNSYFQKVQSWGRETELPVFILGMARSGTTLLEQILSSHPDVFGAGELAEMPTVMAALADGASNTNPRAPRPLPSRAVARDLAAGYLRRLQLLGGPAQRVTIKSLENYMYLGVLATLFAGARVIYCRRNPLDVCVSCYFQNFKSANYSWDLEDLGCHYRQYERLMDHWRRVLPLPILEVRYEELIVNPESVTRKMLDFCGLGWHERCLAYFKNPRPVRTASRVQVRRPLFTKSIDRWKHYESHLGPLFQALRRPAASGASDEPQARPCDTWTHEP